MRTFLIATTAILAILLAPLGVRVADKMLAERTTSETIQTAVKDEAIPASPDTLEQFPDLKIQDVKKIITLEARNMVVLRGPVTGSSVGKAMKQLQAASRSVPQSTPLYLVLDTPGGSIMDGLDLIDFAKALPQKVHTVSLFAASMGFQIAQNLDNRYIIRNGTLMSHRASVRGLGGQVKGELETRYKMIRRSVDYLDYVAAKRMGIDVKTYENLIFNEYWVYGFDAVSNKAADEQILVKCGSSLNGSDTVEFQTFFGPVKVTFSQCPLIKEPESIDFSGILDLEDRKEIEKVIKMGLEDKPRFVDEFIVTSRFYEFFR